MENKVFVSKNDRQDRSLTGQVRDQAGHCPLTGRYLQPWFETFPARSRSFVKSLLGSKAHAQGMRGKMGERNKNQWRIQGRGPGGPPPPLPRPQSLAITGGYLS